MQNKPDEDDGYIMYMIEHIQAVTASVNGTTTHTLDSKTNNDTVHAT